MRKNARLLTASLAALSLVVAACVVPKPEAKVLPEEIVDFCRKAGFARYELPKHVLVVPEIPKGDTGKLQRRVMAERAAAMLQ